MMMEQWVYGNVFNVLTESTYKAGYMRLHQQIQALVSENEALKQQNNVLLASQDAYKFVFCVSLSLYLILLQECLQDTCKLNFPRYR